MNARHILFDLDGTLIDSAPSILSGFARVLDQHGISPRCELTQALIGPPLLETLRLISGIDDPEILQRLAHDFKSYYDEIGYKETREYPGTTLSLRGFAAEGAQLYVVTNKRIVPTRRIISFLGWSDLFKGLYSPDKFVPKLASKSETIDFVKKKHMLNPTQSIYVGDTPQDLEAARENGIEFLAANWGYGSWEKVEGKNFAMLYSLKDISIFH